MSNHKKHNPERNLFRGRSYKKGGHRVRYLREQIARRNDSKHSN